MTPGNIILLNGASSTGKTSILQALQEVLDAPYLNLGIDKLISTLPTSDQAYPLWDEVLGCSNPRRCQLISGMHHAIAAAARAGNDVLADHLLIEPSWIRECAQLLCALPVWLVGVRSPLATLVVREQAYSDRSPGQARVPVDAVHTPGVYDLEVDTALLSPQACALQIKRHLQEGPPPTAMRWLKVWSDPTRHRGWLRR